VGLTTLHHKNKLVTKTSKGPWTWTDSLDKRPKRRNMDMSFGTLTTWHPLSVKVGDKQQSCGRYSSLAGLEKNEGVCTLKIFIIC
jgi:hypothetical protein